MKNRAIEPGLILHNTTLPGFTAGSDSVGILAKARVAVYMAQAFQLRQSPLRRFNGAVIEADIYHKVMMIDRIPFRTVAEAESTIYGQIGRISND